MQDPESIDQLVPDNSRHREAMLQLIASGEAIAFVGAGLSRPLYPTWAGFLNKLAAEASSMTRKVFTAPPGVTEADLLGYADAIQQHCRNHDSTLNSYYGLIGRSFGGVPERCTDTQRRLVRLPFRGFVTTNYDEGLEEALLDAGSKHANCGVVIKREEDHHTVSDFLLSLNGGIQHVRVAHLHGIHDQTRHIILTRSDYDKAYLTPLTERHPRRLDDWPVHRKVVWALLATRRLVFFGTSLDDPVLKGVMETVARDLWTEGQAIHYAVLPLETDSLNRLQSQQAELGHFGVQAVYYENRDGTYAGLDQLIGEALERSGRQDPLRWLEDVNQETELSLKPRED
jgi:hypothetical protein